MSFDQLKDRIRETPISTIISHYMTLNKKGTSLVGLCPFHADSKPSMNVSDAKGMFKCFACGAGGDAITFVKDFTKVDFVEALKDIAGKLGLPFEEYQKEKKKNPRLEMAFRVLNASTKLYKKVSTQNPVPYIEFLDKRKINTESIEKFQIGYAPGQNSLLKYLESVPADDRDFAQQTALDLGLVKYNKDRDSYYDFYRDRVMFPIHDHSGQIRGYSSRAVLPDQVPKYLNSGESFAFDKGSILFGFYFAKNSIRQSDQVIIVEGNMDVIMMHQFGFHQSVGTMGVALSDHSIRLLSNMTKNVFLGMDSDAAGKKAMAKINADFMSIGILPKYLNFEPAKDPDEFLLSEGRLALIERQEKAPILLDVLIQEVIPEKIPENLELKLKTLQRVYELLAPLKEHLSASERIVNVAKTLGLKSDSATILQEYREFLSRQKEKPFAAPEKNKLISAEEEIEDLELKKAQETEPALQESGPVTKSEKVFIKEIVCHPEFLTQPNRDEFLAYIGHPEVKRLFQWLVKIYFEIDEAEYVPMVQDELNNGNYCKEMREIVTEALFNYGNKYNEKVIQRMLKDYKVMLRMDQLKSKRKELVEKQKTTHSQNEVDHLLVEISKLDKEIHNLKNTVP
jgi:DNA primase